MAQKNESSFVASLQKIIEDVIKGEAAKKGLEVKRAVALEYQSGFSGRKSEFETDLCVFQDGMPRVVFELKTAPTTHDVMVYSQKADDHKRISPQIVYGMIAERGAVVATKLLKHNRHMDFALYLGGLDDDAIAKVITECIGLCLEESVLRQQIAEGKFTPRGFLRSTRII